MPCISLGEWQASETPGFLWDNVAAGGVLATNVFFNIAVLRLATLAAGCPRAGGRRRGPGLLEQGLWPEAVVVPHNHNHVRAVLRDGAHVPLVGAAVDYTSKRRQFGSVSAWILCFTTLGQASISKQTWFYCSMAWRCPSLRTSAIKCPYSRIYQD